MSTLYSRATLAQAKILRIVEGAVLNTWDAKGLGRDPWIARSIAKRAAGTLSAQWPEVLAASTRLPANGAASGYKCRACERRELLARLRERRERLGGRGLGRTERRLSDLIRRPPLLVLWERIKRQMRRLKTEDPARYLTNIEVLRDIHALRLEYARELLDAGR